MLNASLFFFFFFLFPFFFFSSALNSLGAQCSTAPFSWGDQLSLEVRVLLKRPPPNGFLFLTPFTILIANPTLGFDLGCRLLLRDS